MVLVNCDNKNIILLDEGFIRIFAPFRFFQKILGSCRVDVKDGIVTPPTVLQKCYTIITMATALYFYYKFIACYSPGIVPQMYFKLLAYGIGVLNVAMYMSILQARFFNNEENVRMYIAMKKIDNVLKIIRNAAIHNCHYKHNVAAVLGLAITFSIQLIVVFLVAKGYFGILEQIGSLWPFFSFVFELSCCSSHIIFFTNRVRLINSIITNHSQNRRAILVTLSKRCESIESEDFGSSETDLYDCMKEILNGFACFQDQYRFQIFLFCALCLSWMTVGFQYAIIALQKASSYIDTRLLMVDFIYLGSMAIANVSLLLWISVRIAAFFKEVKKTKKLTIRVLSRCVDADNGPLRQKAKKMFKLIDQTPPCFSVYGMWRMDARVSLSIFQILTSTYVILLQFTFL